MHRDSIRMRRVLLLLVARSHLYRTVADLQKQLTVWEGNVGRLGEVFRKLLSADVTEPAPSAHPGAAHMSADEPE